MTDLAAAKRAADERVLNGLLLAILFVAGVVMVREGPHYDNVFDGWPFLRALSLLVRWRDSWVGLIRSEPDRRLNFRAHTVSRGWLRSFSD
jgi:hypothetical protein